jgi:hypothetical protein
MAKLGTALIEDYRLMMKKIIWNALLVACVSTAVLAAIGVLRPPAHEPKETAFKMPELRQNHPVEFRKGGDGADFLLAGWGSAEEGATWSSENKAWLLLPGTAFTGKTELILKTFPFLHAPELTQQRMEISLSGNKIFESSVDKQDIHTFSIKLPANDLNKDRIVLRFSFPDARSPRELGLSSDIRKLAFELISMQIIPAGAAGQPGEPKAPEEAGAP